MDNLDIYPEDIIDGYGTENFPSEKGERTKTSIYYTEIHKLDPSDDGYIYVIECRNHSLNVTPCKKIGEESDFVVVTMYAGTKYYRHTDKEYNLIDALMFHHREENGVIYLTIPEVNELPLQYIVNKIEYSNYIFLYTETKPWDTLNRYLSELDLAKIKPLFIKRRDNLQIKLDNTLYKNKDEIKYLEKLIIRLTNIIKNI